VFRLQVPTCKGVEWTCSGYKFQRVRVQRVRVQVLRCSGLRVGL